MGDTDYEEEKMRMYRGIISRNPFPQQLQQYNLYHQDSKHQPQLQVVQEKGTLVIFGMLKVYWGTQKVIRLKKEELSWKRRSTRLSYENENGLDEKLMSAMGSGAKTRRSLTKFKDKVDDDDDDDENSTNGHNGAENGSPVGSPDDKPDDVIFSVHGSSTMPHKGRGNMNRRTMSFSGHVYKSNTAVFRPKHGTVSNVRVSSKQTTPEVIQLLLRKFAVENSPTEFNLYEVMTHGESREMKIGDFPLLRRVMLGPDEHVAKIFIMEKKTQEISLEIAQYINLQMPVLEAIIRKFNEEEERELLKIKQRYTQYKANLEKKMLTMSTDVKKRHPVHRSNAIVGSLASKEMLPEPLPIQARFVHSPALQVRFVQSAIIESSVMQMSPPMSPAVLRPVTRVVLTDSNKKKKGLFGWRR